LRKTAFCAGKPLRGFARQAKLDDRLRQLCGQAGVNLGAKQNGEDTCCNFAAVFYVFDFIIYTMRSFLILNIIRSSPASILGLFTTTIFMG
jgi:hypothetical protein